MVEPYLNLNGKANEAIAFYENIFQGRDKTIMQYKDAPGDPNYPIPDELKELVLHAEIDIRGTRMHFSDIQSNVTAGNMISLAVTFHTAEEVESAYNQLRTGGEVLMELGPQFFSPMYGWVKDKFDVSWQLISM